MTNESQDQGQSAPNPFDPDREGWKKSHKNFVDRVDRVMVNPLDATFGNNCAFHAAYLIYKFFLKAQKRVRILSGHLSRQAEDGTLVYGAPEIIAAIRLFLSRKDTALQIVLDSELDDGTKHPLYKALDKMRGDGKLKGHKVEIRQLKGTEAQSLVDDDLANHMLLMDNCGFRLETDVDKAEAIVNVNSKHTFGLLGNFFDNKLLKMEHDVVWGNP